MIFRSTVFVCIAFAFSGFAQKTSETGIKVSEKEQIKRLRSRVEPIYPPNVLRAGVRGSAASSSKYFGEAAVCQFDVFITSAGKLASARLLDGDTNICVGAEEAIRKWGFEPTVVSGQPAVVVTTLTVPMRFNVIDPSGKSFGMDDIIELYRRQLQMFYDSNPNQTSAQRPLFFRDHSGRTYIAGFEQGTGLGNQMGGREDFLVMAVDAEDFRSRVILTHYFELSNSDARAAVARSFEKTDPGIWLAYNSYRWNGYNNLKRVIELLQTARPLSELH